MYLGHGQALRIMNCYGYAEGRHGLDRNADLLMEGIAWLNSQCGVPAFLVGDLNCDIAATG